MSKCISYSSTLSTSFSNSKNQSELIIAYVITEMTPIIDYFFSYNIHYLYNYVFHDTYTVSIFHPNILYSDLIRFLNTVLDTEINGRSYEFI